MRQIYLTDFPYFRCSEILYMSYQPGTHIIAALHSNETGLLNSFEEFKAIVDGLVKTHELTNLGEVYHNFSPAGFTAVICLSESHISVHTWPEFGKVNLDIYLSNYLRSNDRTVIKLYDAMCRFFNASIVDCQTIYR